MEDKKGTATNRDGLGSTYAGTQTPDDTAPDAYQKPTGKEQQDGNDNGAAEKTSFGKEYDTPSSYGDKDSKPDTKGVEQGESDKEEGSPIR